MKTSVSVLLMTLLLFGTVIVAFDAPAVKASGVVYIRADGSIDPPTAPIVTSDNVTYTLTNDITTDADGIVVERDNIVFDGAAHTLQGFGDGYGVDLTGRTNVTVRNTCIRHFFAATWLESSSSNNISDNSMSNNDGDVKLFLSPNNTISRNILTNSEPMNGESGSYLYASPNNSVYGNTFTNTGLYCLLSYENFVQNNTVNGKPLVYLEDASDCTVENAGQVMLVRCENIRVEGLDLSSTNVGIGLDETSNCTISGNTIAANTQFGLILHTSQDIRVFHNSFVNGNFFDIEISNSEAIWDNGYPAGGNYWGRYGDTDVCKGPDQDMAGEDGIWDHPYAVKPPFAFLDRYPLTKPYGEPTGDVDGDCDTDIFDIVRIAGLYGVNCLDPRYDRRCDMNLDGDVDIFDLVGAAINYGKYW